jgi:indoleacetamide hydrolase
MTDLHELGVVEASVAIRRSEVTSEALASALLRRAQTLKSLNAFITLDSHRILSAARAADRKRATGGALGPLHGVPIAIKDNIDTADMPTTAGTPALRGNRPAANAPVVQALIDAGAIVFGKTGMHELAFGITCNNAAYGPIRNPFDPSRIPGGSSGGSGAAVGACLVPGAIGTDTGGSVRIPAAYCGVAGFRPTVGRWPQAGVVPISSTRDTAGPLARSVADLTAIDRAVTGRGETTGAKPLTAVRLGVPRAFFWDDLDAETARICEAALDELRRAGATLVVADIPDVRTLDEAVGFPVALYEVRRDLDRYLERAGLPLRFAGVVKEIASSDVRQILGSQLDATTAISKQAYLEAMERSRPRLVAAVSSYFTDHNLDAIAFPTAPLPPPAIGENETVVLNGRAVPTFTTVVRNSGPGSNAGIPGVSLPVGLTRRCLRPIWAGAKRITSSR